MIDNVIEWRDIEGYEGLYQISTQGEVISLPARIKSGKSYVTKKARIISLGICSRGYPNVCLSKNNKRKKFRIHRLLSKAFIPNPNNYCCINHKNGIKSDYSLSNLEWCTSAQNVHHAIAHGLYVAGKDRKNAKKVINKCTGETYGSIKDAADNLNLNYKYCSRALNSKHRAHKCLRFAA